MEKKIPTAEELAEKLLIKYHGSYSSFNRVSFTGKQLKMIAVEFAKLHVQAALENAWIKAKLKVVSNEEYREEGEEDLLDEYECGSDTVVLHKDSIINAYPLENIK